MRTDRVGLFVTKVTISLEDQTNERHQVGEDAQEPHDGEVYKRITHVGAGGCHFLATEAVKLGVGEILGEANESGWRRVDRRWALPPR